MAVPGQAPHAVKLLGAEVQQVVRLRDLLLPERQGLAKRALPLRPLLSGGGWPLAEAVARAAPSFMKISLVETCVHAPGWFSIWVLHLGKKK